MCFVFVFGVELLLFLFTLYRAATSVFVGSMSFLSMVLACVCTCACLCVCMFVCRRPKALCRMSLSTITASTTCKTSHRTRRRKTLSSYGIFYIISKIAVSLCLCFLLFAMRKFFPYCVFLVFVFVIFFSFFFCGLFVGTAAHLVHTQQSCSEFRATTYYLRLDFTATSVRNVTKLWR